MYQMSENELLTSRLLNSKVIVRQTWPKLYTTSLRGWSEMAML